MPYPLFLSNLAQPHPGAGATTLRHVLISSSATSKRWRLLLFSKKVFGTTTTTMSIVQFLAARFMTMIRFKVVIGKTDVGT